MIEQYNIAFASLGMEPMGDMAWGNDRYEAWLEDDHGVPYLVVVNQEVVHHLMIKSIAPISGAGLINLLNAIGIE